MTNDMFYRIIERTNSCQIKQLREALDFLYSHEFDFDETREIAVIDIMERVMSLPRWVGSADEFHNLSVFFANKSNILWAYKVICRGVVQYSKSIDLIADYIKYGTSCDGSEEQCEHQFNVLQSIARKRWTWRAFDFSIDYLFVCIDKGVEEEEAYLDKIKNLTDEYIKAFPDDERAYIAKSNFTDLFLNRKIEAIELLVQGIGRDARTPRCSLRLADIFFEKKDYKSSLDYIEKCKAESIAFENSVSNGYVYALSALNKISILYSKWSPGQEISNEIELEINDIYRDYRASRVFEDWQSERIQNLKKQLDVLAELTGISGNY